MRKPYRYDELSDRRCKTPGCNRRIKKNVLDRIPAADTCYRCFSAKRFARRNNLGRVSFNFQIR